LALSAAAAQATPLPVVSASLGGGQGCPTASCTSPTLSWSSSSGGGSGSVDLDTGALTLTFSITLSSSTFLPTSGPSDNGVTQLDFTDVTYSGSATLMDLGGGLYWITGGSASVAGTQTPTGAGSAGAFSASESLLSGSCTDIAGSVSCGIIFSTENDFNFLVNGETRYFTHTLNVTAMPEPLGSVSFLVTLLVGGAAVRKIGDVRGSSASRSAPEKIW
jgi:hypothetical protein